MMMTMKWKKERKKVHAYIKMANIHFNPPGKLAFKSNNFSLQFNPKLQFS